jgi:hypothetical protein
VISLVRYFVCLITLVPSLPALAEAFWSGWQGDGTSLRGAVVIVPYYGCHGLGYSYNAGMAAVIRLTGGYGYVPNYSYACGYPICGHYGHRHVYPSVHGIRRVRAYRSATADSSPESATPRVSSPLAKTVQTAAAGSASPKSAWTPMTVPVLRSPVSELPKTATEESGRATNDWAKKLQQKLNTLSPDMSAASALLEQEGFRVDSGNKSATGWFLTAHDSNQRRGSIKLQSDGTKIVLTVTG